MQNSRFVHAEYEQSVHSLANPSHKEELFAVRTIRGMHYSRYGLFAVKAIRGKTIRGENYSRYTLSAVKAIRGNIRGWYARKLLRLGYVSSR